jgi:hypothetical protein
MYTEKHLIELFNETFFFCLTLGQTGTGVLSYPWVLCLSHHFFVMLYITCQFNFFFIHVLRCLYIEDDNRFIFLAEIKNVGKPETDIDV